MTDKVRAYAEKNRMFRKGDRVIAAVSGGADSLALLVILCELREELGFELAALHVNHGLRRITADRDEQFVKEFCGERNIPCLTYQVEVRPYAKENHLSLEEAARVLRYRAIGDAAESNGATVIAVAHHEIDQAETVLFQMLRGSGLKGLSGMAPVRSGAGEFGFSNRKVRVVRPLLCVGKEEIIDFLKENHLTWMEDETNASDEPSRNRIRHRIIPALRDIRPDAVEKINETDEYLARVDSYLRQEAADWLMEHRTPPEKKKEAEIPAEPFSRTPDVLREYIILELLRGLKVSMKDVGRAQIEAVSQLSDRQVGKKIRLSNGVTAEKTYETLRLFISGEALDKTGAAPEAEEDLPIMETRELSPADPMDFPKSDCVKWFDYDKINFPVVLRYREEGDLFSAVEGGHKKLKDVFIDLKIPKERRDRVPLLASGREILWIVGMRMSEEYKVTPGTKRVLEVTVLAEEERRG